MSTTKQKKIQYTVANFSLHTWQAAALQLIADKNNLPYRSEVLMAILTKKKSLKKPTKTEIIELQDKYGNTRTNFQFHFDPLNKELSKKLSKEEQKRPVSGIVREIINEWLSN